MAKKGDPGLFACTGVQHDEDLRKPELVLLVKSLRLPKKYVIDELASQKGHQVLRLPPYYCDLNPIELIWSQLKGLMRQKNQGGRLEVLEKRLLQCCDEISPLLWENCCRHVQQLETDYWIKDGPLDDIDPLIISVGSDRDSGSDEEDDSDDGDDDDGGNDLVCC